MEGADGVLERKKDCTKKCITLEKEGSEREEHPCWCSIFSQGKRYVPLNLGGGLFGCTVSRKKERSLKRSDQAKRWGKTQVS